MFALLAAMLLAHPAAPAPAPPPSVRDEWELLGTRVVNFRAEKDVIRVTGREGRFRAIKLEEEGGNIDMYNIRVVFGDGTDFSPQTRVEFRQGSWRAGPSTCPGTRASSARSPSCIAPRSAPARRR